MTNFIPEIQNKREVLLAYNASFDYFCGRLSFILNHLIKKSVIFGLCRGKIKIPVRVFLNLAQWLAAMLRKYLIQSILEVHDMFRGNLNLYGLAFYTASHNLMQQDFRVRKSHTLTFGAGREQHRAH